MIVIIVEFDNRQLNNTADKSKLVKVASDLWEDQDTTLVQCSLESPARTGSRSVQPFLQGAGI